MMYIDNNDVIITLSIKLDKVFNNLTGYIHIFVFSLLKDNKITILFLNFLVNSTDSTAYIVSTRICEKIMWITLPHQCFKFYFADFEID